VKDSRKKRALQSSHRNGRTSTTLRTADSKKPLRLDR
jgi:hypothetical protein